MTKEELINLVKTSIGDENLKYSGAVLYSSLKSTEKIDGREGKIYFLGINPGGDAEEMKEYTIAKHIDCLTDTKNEYLHGDWNGKPGESKLQKRVKFMFKDLLRLEIEKVLSSNLIFIRSSHVESISGYDYYRWADLSWKFHLAMIKNLKKSLIISNGIGNRSAFMYLQERYKPKNIVYKNSGHSNWSIGKYDIQIYDQNITVIGMPHLSYYTFEGDKKYWAGEIFKGWVQKH